MPVVRVWTCDLPGCTATTTADGDDPPPAWHLLTINEAGITRLAFDRRDHLAEWVGAAISTGAIPYETARAIVRERERNNPKPPKPPRDPRGAVRARTKADTRTTQAG